jgi:WhiB family transcriptional regulator, redox-sensing transcriptional regulator
MTAADEKRAFDSRSVQLDRPTIDRQVARWARCADPRGSYTRLFFSDHPNDVARARAICERCTVRELCLFRARERREPIGVWGGECLLDGEVVAARRGRGRPPNDSPPTIVDEVTGHPSSPRSVRNE